MLNFPDVFLESVNVEPSPTKDYASCRKFLAKVFRQSRDQGSLPRYISRKFKSLHSIEQLAHLQVMRFSSGKRKEEIPASADIASLMTTLITPCYFTLVNYGVKFTVKK